MSKSKGFTLIEVAIVLLIGGIVLGSASAVLLTYLEKVQNSTTEERMAAIDEALQLFLSLNGRYPCAAERNALADSAEFGVEIDDVDCALPAEVSTVKATGRDGRIIRIGTVPVRTLNLPDDYIADAWGSRFTYAVTEMLATDGTYGSDQGGIFLVDNAEPPDLVTDSLITPPGAAHYVLLSHGKTRGGATDIAGGGTTPCNVGTLEEENCDDDEVFRNTLLTGTAANASFFDDRVLFKVNTPFGNDTIPPSAVMAFNLSACPTGWVPFAAGDGRFIIGADGTTYNVGDSDGLEDVALTEQEIGFEDTGVTVDPAALPPGGSSFVAAIPGGALAHSNLPPYISLLYCEKT